MIGKPKPLHGTYLHAYSIRLICSMHAEVPTYCIMYLQKWKIVYKVDTQKNASQICKSTNVTIMQVSLRRYIDFLK